MVKRSTSFVISCLILILSFSPKVSATAISLSKSVVKINSHATSISAAALTGSGVLVKYKDQRWVLTSDHIVYHSNKNFKHTVTLESGLTATANFLAADSGRGFAVLELQENFAEELYLDIPLESSEGVEAIVIGYPVESAEALTSTGKISSDPAEGTNIFPQISELTSVTGAYAEFGMSGGALFVGDRLAGLLSHISPNDTALDILAVPIADIRPVLASFDKTKNFFSAIRLTQDPAQQLSEFQSYRTGLLYLTWVKPFPNSTRGVEVLLTKSQSTELLYADHHLKVAQDFLKRNTDVRLRFIGFRKKNRWDQISGSTQDLTNNLRLLYDPELEPLWIIQGYEQKGTVERIHLLASALLNRLAKLPSVPLLKNKLESIQRLTDCSQHRDMEETICYSAGPWRLIKPKDLEVILNDPIYAAEWNGLDNKRDEQPVRDSFNELISLFQNITL